ncbi:MAG: TonB-dependent receptor [Ignavibacteria bacterium]
MSQIEALNDSVLIKTETIEVDALKGFARFTPITFENISREEVEKKYWMQDLPVFLNGNTSVNSYSESGASVGYSYLSLRGFDQKRISISVNGIPQNDPEDHQVYWVDISDLTASVEDIQLQRGIGTALYGSSSIGGAVNVKTINFFNRKFLTLSGAAGDFNSKRYSVEYSSGLLKNGYGFYGKFTNLKSDGYRDLSWSDHWGYFLSAGKIIGKNSMLKFNLYGSPIKNHLAYLGVNKEYLDGKISGNKLVDRKYNYLTYADETDNYFQPHYELLYDQQISKNVFISNSLSYTRGEGYFNTFFPVYYGYEFDYFRLNSFFVSDSTTYDPQYYRRNPDGTFYFEKGKGFEIVRSDIVTKLTVNNNTYGWFPKIKITHNNGKGILVTGGEIRYHKSEHSGEVTFGSALPPGTQPIHQFYFYNGGKRTYSFFANEIYSVSGKLNAMLGIQYVYHRYNLTNDKFKPYDFNVDYNFLTPRAGLNYNFNDRINMYANFSIAKREPRLKDIYNGEDPNSKPNFRILDPSKGIYEDPLLQPEVMHDYEAGVGYNKNNFNAELNFYYMNFNNEIVNNGQLDNVGQSIVGNAAKSVHRGLELEIKFKPANNNYLKDFSISGNLNLSENYFEDYKEISGLDSSGNIIYGNDYSGNKIILNPELIGNFSLNYFPDYGLNAYVAIQYIGKQYLDNSQNERKNPNRKNEPGYIDKIINPYTVVNAGLSLNLVSILNKKKPVGIFQSAEINFKANNIFNILYETTGNISDGIPYWIPAATRNFYGELKIGF